MGMEDVPSDYQDEHSIETHQDYGQHLSSMTEGQADDFQDPLNDTYGSIQTDNPYETQEGKQTTQIPEKNDSNAQDDVEKPTDSDETSLPEYEALQKRLEKNRFDPTSWNRLIDLAEESGDLEKIKQAYESLLSAYPNIADAQIAYLEHFMQPGLYPHAEALFNRFLRPSPSVQLWKFYLTYVRRMNADPSTRDMVIKAYEFSLLYIGQDKDSSEIWREYLDFLKAGETHNTWEEQQKMDALRRVYQRVVQIPLENLEQLWSEYNAFEVGLNKITARKFIQDLSKAYMTAKEALKQVRSHLAILCPPPAPVPPTSAGRKPFNLLEPTSPQNEGHRMRAKSWRAYLQWEEKNPLDIEDKSVYNARVYATYKKAVVRMRFNPETWYMAYSWIEKNIKPDEAIGYLKNGLDANPASFILNFAYAEALEAAKNYVEVHNLFNRFIELLHEELEKQFQILAPDPTFTMNGTAIVQHLTTSASSSGNSSSGDLTPLKEFLKRRTELCIAWITYMRFARRAEGLKPARAVFGKARKDKWIGWEVYEAAASLEYHFTKMTDVPTRIYETGLTKFQSESEYVMRYLKFLISINDETNARALFERMIGTFTPEKARPLWETWLGYEYNYGDLTSAIKLEKRMSEIYPEDNSMRRFAQRHMYGNHDPIAERDLGYVRMPGGSGSSTSSNGSTKLETPAPAASSIPTPVLQPPAKRPTSSERGRPGPYSEPPDIGPPPPSKRARESSPPRERDRRDRDRRDAPPPIRRRYGSPDWGRNSPPPPRRGGDVGHSRDWDKDPSVHDDHRSVVPPPATFFLGLLPPHPGFDGPVFRVDDLMQVFRTASIPSGAGGPPPPPPRARSPPRGRPPPDYSPYQGPGGGRPTRRY
ncbi:hypothetical protein Clacol_002164 [Clathrus columnatus]|uniref:mRNA 3'-end-processing protein RNA14 n=1 Tax=Clathrus columnatus TaxID=1419009 RepID=A0AAV5A2W4_9AGAM|nr:hypothetical protein Clacol_002164 [Clathrus columnatus]